MKPFIMFVIAALLLASPLDAAELQLGSGSQIRFADVAAGQAVMTTADDYLNRLSPFDLSARLETDKAVTVEEFKEHLAAQVLPWTDELKSRLRPILKSVADKLACWKLDFPETVLLVRTTGIGEAHAAYTRGNAVVLPDALLEWPEKRLTDLIIHELFHVLSRQNPELRDQLYQIVGFKMIGEITLPENLAQRKITNPDAPVIAHAVRLLVNDELVYVVPVLLSRQATYDVQQGGAFFQYMQFRLLEVERTDTGWQVALSNGEPMLHSAETTPTYLETIGRNTPYIIHPEEVLADNFVLLVQGREDVASPHILAELDRHLRRMPDDSQ